MRLTFLSSADRDVVSIISYLSDELDDPELADRTVTDIFRKIERLRDFPSSGKRLEDISSEHADYRQLVANKYIVVYKLGKASVDIIRVVHASFDYTRLF